MQAGDRITATVGAVAFGGDGVARVARRVVFIPFTAEGDVVEVEITQVKKSFARGCLVRILAPSPDRVPPVCNAYGRCGGCRYQHMSYAREIELKGRQVAEVFARIGKIADPPVRAIIPSPCAYGYRGKITLHIRRPRGRPLRIGFVDVTGSAVVDIGQCEIAAPAINDMFAAFRGGLPGTLSTVPGERLTLWAAEEGIAFGGGGGAAPHRRVRVDGRDLIAPAGGFFQANTSLAPRLVEEVTQACGLAGTETVLDCYCGSGLFARFLAPAAAAVHGVEWNEDAVHCAKLNMEEAGFTNTHFHVGDVGDVLAREFVAKGNRPDVIVLDPPRTGLEMPVREALAVLAPRTLVYVSCNPATQARDCRYLLDRGFALEFLQPVDMFPRTAHVEVVARLTVNF